MSQHALSVLEQELRRRRPAIPRPPRRSDWKGSKDNQSMRDCHYRSALHHWHKYQANGRGMTQEERDRRELGTWQEWIRGSRAQASAVQSIAKFQAAGRARRG